MAWLRFTLLCAAILPELRGRGEGLPASASACSFSHGLPQRDRHHLLSLREWMRTKVKLSWGHSFMTWTERSPRPSKCRYGKCLQQNAREEGRAACKSWEERVCLITQAFLCSATRPTPAGLTDEVAVPPLEALFFLVEQTEQQREGGAGGKLSPCGRGETNAGGEEDCSCLPPSASPSRRPTAGRGAEQSNSGLRSWQRELCGCAAALPTCVTKLLLFVLTGGAPQSLPPDQTGGAEQLGKQGIHLPVQSRCSRQPRKGIIDT